MIIVSGTMSIKADQIEVALPAAITMQNETVKEDGCISYRFYADLEDKTLFHFFEEWESDAHLDAHFKTPHMAVFLAVLKDAAAGPSTIYKYTIGEKIKL